MDDGCARCNRLGTDRTNDTMKRETSLLALLLRRTARQQLKPAPPAPPWELIGGPNCSKCGSDFTTNPPTVKYANDDMRGERLVLTCPVCSFKWDKPVLSPRTHKPKITENIHPA